MVHKALRGTASAGLWNGISSETAKLKQQCLFELGEGIRIRFW